MTTETAPAAVEAPVVPPPVAEATTPAAPKTEPTQTERALAVLRGQKEEAKPEAKAEAAPEAPKEEAKPDPMERSFAALAKGTEKLRKEREAFETERATQKGRDDKAAAYEALEAAAKENPLAVLERLGIPFEGLVDHALKSGLPAKEAPKSEAAALRETVEKMLAKDKAREEAEAKAKETATQAQRDEQEKRARSFVASKLAEAVKASGERFELLGAAMQAKGDEPSNLVFTLMETHHQQTGEILQVEEAAALAEAHYEEKAEAEYLPFLTTSKLRAKVSGVGSPQPPASRPREASGQRSPSTLTNSQAAVSPAPQAHLSQPEREKEALRLLRAARGTAE